ncbi:MAG TPA: Mpo1-like protein [Mucilaginibacter sp.]|jgi:Predicted membrane protein
MRNQKIEKRPIDVIIDQYDSFHQKPANRLINYFCIPLIVFSIVGFVWSLPFPQLKFLSSYISYLNWGSFLIAFSVYYYMRLSPLMSYILLLILFALVYIAIQMQGAEKTGGFVLPQVCVFIFIMANIAQFIGYRIEGKKPTFNDEFKFILTAPIWLLSLVLKKFGVKY